VALSPRRVMTVLAEAKSVADDVISDGAPEGKGPTS
jgi:hypothetical protein